MELIKSNKQHLLRLLLALIALVVVISTLAAFFRDIFEPLSAQLLRRLGAPGVGFGTFLADAIHFPVPPQFYMLATIASGSASWLPMVGICIGSIAGGVIAFYLGGSFTNVRFIESRLIHTRQVVEKLVSRYGIVAPFIATITPISFSTMCNVFGFYKMPKRLLYLLLLLRIPRLLFYYFVIKSGWGLI